MVPPSIGPSLSGLYSHLFQEVKSPLAGTFFFSHQEIPGEIPISCGFHCSSSQIEGETGISLHVFVSSGLTTVMEADFILLGSVTEGIEHNSYTQALRSSVWMRTQWFLFLTVRGTGPSLNQSCHRHPRKVVVEPA